MPMVPCDAFCKESQRPLFRNFPYPHAMYQYCRGKKRTKGTPDYSCILCLQKMTFSNRFATYWTDHSNWVHCRLSTRVPDPLVLLICRCIARESHRPKPLESASVAWHPESIGALPYSRLQRAVTSCPVIRTCATRDPIGRLLASASRSNSSSLRMCQTVRASEWSNCRLQCFGSSSPTNRFPLHHLLPPI